MGCDTTTPAPNSLIKSLGHTGTRGATGPTPGQVPLRGQPRLWLRQSPGKQLSGGLCVPLGCWRSPGEGYSKACSHGLGCSPAGKWVGSSSPITLQGRMRKKRRQQPAFSQGCSSFQCSCSPLSPQVSPQQRVFAATSCKLSPQTLPRPQRADALTPSGGTISAEKRAALGALTDQKDEICSSMSSAALRTWAQFCQLTQQ